MFHVFEFTGAKAVVANSMYNFREFQSIYLFAVCYACIPLFPRYLSQRAIIRTSTVGANPLSSQCPKYSGNWNVVPNTIFTAKALCPHSMGRRQEEE